MSIIQVANSPMQAERLRLLAMGAGSGLPDHCFTVALDITGPVSAPALQAGVTGLIRRHPALRAEFDTASDHHRVREGLDVRLDRRVMPGASAAARWQAALEWAHADASRPFDLRPPMVRATALAIDPERCLVVLSFDHLIMDAWSSNLAVRAFVAAADAAARGVPADDTESTAYPRARGTTDALLRSARGLRAVERQRARLGGFRDRVPLPGGPAPSAPAEMLFRALPVADQVATALSQRVRTAKGSMFAVAMAAFATTFSGLVDEPTLVYSTFACRENATEESAIGWLSNRVGIPLPAPNDTVLSYLNGLRRELVVALAHQNLPAPEIARRHAGRPGNPFRTMSGPSSEQFGPGVLDEVPTRELSVSVQYQPAEIHESRRPESLRIGAATVRPTGVSMCPSGTEVDLFLLERPAMLADTWRPPMALYAMASSDRRDALGLDLVLTAWNIGLTILSEVDWEQTSFLDVCRLVAGDRRRADSR